MALDRIKEVVGSLVTGGDGDPYSTTDPRVVRAFEEDEDNTTLVSFPRTGSHWLRMLIELYFERPLLTRTFFFPDRTDYLLIHTHDLELDVQRRKVIYLYRNPVDTVYSQLRYHEEPTRDDGRVRHWADLYGRHLDKWLDKETFTRRKTVVRFEGMRRDLPAEFEKVCAHFDADLDPDRFETVASRVDKDLVKQKTPHDPKVVNPADSYHDNRESFREEQGDLVWETVLDGRDHLRERFDGG